MAELFVVATGVISLVAFALQSIQQLIGTIDAIKDALVTLSVVQQDLRALATNLENLEARATKEGRSHQRHAGATGQPGGKINSGLAQSLKSCKTDCDVFKNGLEQWLKHLETGQISVRDKLMLGWIKSGLSVSYLFHERSIITASGSQLLRYHCRRADFTSLIRNNMPHTETKQRSIRTASQPFTFSTALDKHVVKRYIP